METDLAGQSLTEAAKAVARKIHKDPKLLESLEKWWTGKYHLPWNHDLFQTRTLFDLLVEYQLDYFESNPLEVHRNPDGHIQFVTGDEVIDRWEAAVARGETPNLAADLFSEEALAKLQRLRARGGSRTRGGGSFKSVVDEVARDAQRQGLSVPGGPVLQKQPWLHRSNFGDGVDE